MSSSTNTGDVLSKTSSPSSHHRKDQSDYTKGTKAQKVFETILRLWCFFVAKSYLELMLDWGCKYLSSQSSTVWNQSWEFCGFRTQWPSSGNIKIFESIPLRWTDVNNCIPSPIGTR